MSVAVLMPPVTKKAVQAVLSVAVIYQVDTFARLQVIELGSPIGAITDVGYRYFRFRL